MKVAAGYSCSVTDELEKESTPKHDLPLMTVKKNENNIYVNPNEMPGETGKKEDVIECTVAGKLQLPSNYPSTSTT